MANYPWDGTEDRQTHYSESPDDKAFVHLARAYAEAHATMSGSAEFPGGITNGAHWYPLWGGMQVSAAMPGCKTLMQADISQGWACASRH